MKHRTIFLLIFILLLIAVPFIFASTSGSTYTVGSSVTSIQGKNGSGSIYSARTYSTFNTGGNANGSIYQGIIGFFGQFMVPPFHHVKIIQTSPVQAGSVYSVTIDDTNSSSDSIVTSAPQITIYDSLNNLIVSNANSNLISAKVYQYNFTTSLTHVAGTWTTNITMGVNGVTEQYGSGWNLSNGHTAIGINSISTSSSPTINADITITNEDSSAYEYPYEYCIVSTITEQCGNANNVAYGSGFKLLSAGQSWNSILSLNIPASGNYWFKVLVHYGTQQSGASESFSAVVPPVNSTTSATTTQGAGTVSTTTVVTGSVTLPAAEYLLSLDTRILDGFKIVKPGDKVSMEVTLYNTGTSFVKEAVMNYCIKGSNEEIIKCSNETIAVNPKTQLVKDLLVPTDLKNGEYYVDTEAYYGNKTASSEDSFEVKSAVLNIQNNVVTNNFLPISLGIIILILLIIIIYRRRKAGGMKHKTIMPKARPMPSGTVNVDGERYLNIKPRTSEDVREAAKLRSYVLEKDILAGIKKFLSKLHNKKYPRNSTIGLVNKKVYSDTGNYIGRVSDVIFEEGKIKSLKIRPDQRYNLGGRGIVIDYRHTRNVGEIIIVNGNILRET